MDLTPFLTALQEKALLYIYWELVVAIIAVSYIAIKLFKSDAITLHPKWVTLFVAIFLAGVKWLTDADFDPWRGLVSLALSVTFYDYIVKVILDWIKGKHPLKDNL